MSEQTSALHLARSRILELEEALSDLLLLPVAVQEFHYLDRGIGTKTFNAAWLRARSVLNKENGNATEQVMAAGEPLPRIEVELPQDDTRTATVRWTERTADGFHVCISVSDGAQSPKENDRA